MVALAGAYPTDASASPSDTSWLFEPTTGVHLFGGRSVFDVARNMGTSVQVIQNYYGKHATPIKLATQLGG